MVRLWDKDSNASIGTISAEELQQLAAALEEESSTDNDYYLDQATLDYLAAQGVASGTLELLRGALGARDNMEFCWEAE